MTEEGNEFSWKKINNIHKSATKNEELSAPSALEASSAPCMYEVSLVNENQIPMDFLTLILKKFFNKSQEEATYITLEAHNRGHGICGKYTRDVAETKITLVSDYAHKYNYDIKCVMQKEPYHAIKKP
jgi:ATP-dependent Clp protease adaptor protein ClpS